MHFQQFHLRQLGHASYLVGDESSGAAIVVDPQLHVDGYVAAARDAGLRIEWALDTHAHSDYVSGRDALARATGARVLVSAHGTQATVDQRAIGDGEVLMLGSSTWLEAAHVPGHAPEQLALLVGSGTDRTAVELVLSGGSLLCGDVGRPDIDESEPAHEIAPRAVARIRERLLALDDHVAVYPTHVEGSLCSAGPAGGTRTTIGHERRTNAWLQPDADIAPLLARLPRKPAFWSTLRQGNEAGAFGDAATITDLPRLDARTALHTGALLVDARDAEDYAAAHVAGSVQLGASAAAPVLAGALLAPSDRTVVVAHDEDDALRLAHDLQRAGVAAPLGWVAADLDAWHRDGVAIDVVATPTAIELHRTAPGRRVLDVRQPAEWADHGTLDGALLVSLPDLPELGRDLPAEPLVVACAAGRRSITAVSILRHLGRRGDESVAGGVDAWSDAARSVSA